MARAVPQARWAEQQIEAQWQGGVSEKPKVVQQAYGENGQRIAGLVQVAEQQDAAG